MVRSITGSKEHPFELDVIETFSLTGRGICIVVAFPTMTNQEAIDKYKGNYILYKYEPYQIRGIEIMGQLDRVVDRTAFLLKKI